MTNKIFKLKTDYAIHESIDAGRFWLFNVSDGAHYEINDTASFILKNLDGVRTASLILKEIVSEFEVDCEEARNDLNAALLDWQEQGIIETEE